MANKVYGYTVVAYPESMPTDYVERLNKLPFGYLYALHDKDTKKNEDGQEEPKKAHMHFYFQGKPTKKQIEYIYASLNVSYGEYVRSANDMVDYLTHENHPDKYHYSKDIIQQSAKWNQELFECALTTVKDDTFDIIKFIEERDIIEYSDLLMELLNEGRDDLLKSSKQYWVMRYIQSRHFKGEEK